MLTAAFFALAPDKMCPDDRIRQELDDAVLCQDALIGQHTAVQRLLLSKGGKLFRKGVGLVEYNDKQPFR
jgi:hypothetical protein